MAEEPLRVLLVDDEWSLREPLAKRLRDGYDYDVDTAADATEAQRLVVEAARPYDVALIDDLLTPEPEAEPEPIGIELIGHIREHCPETECIVFTGWGMERALAALRAGAYRYLAKPLNLDELGMTIRMAAEQARLRRERDLLSATLTISNLMVSRVDVARTLAVIVDAVPRVVGADVCTVARMDPTTDRIEYEPSVPLGNGSVRWHQHLKGIPLTRQIIETGEVFILSDVDARADEVDDNLRQAGVKSFVGMPIPGEPRSQGVLYAYSTRQKAFGPHEKRVLQLLAGQASIALENARLFEAEAQRRREAETLRETALALTTTLDQQEIFKRILTDLQKVVPYDSASVQLLKESCLEIIGGRGFPNSSEIVGLSFPVDGDNPNREVLHRRDYFIVPDAPAVYEDFLKEPHVQADIHGWLGVPMLVGDRLIGMIALDSHQPGFYTEEHARLAQTFAAQAALAIENARLFNETDRRARNLETLQTLALTINSSLDLDETLKRACQAAVKFLNADHSGLVLFDSDYAQGRVKAEYPTVGTLGKIIPVRGVPAEEQLIETKEPLVIPDMTSDDSLGSVLDIFREFDIQSILIVPVVGNDEGRVLGSFSLDAMGHHRQFTDEEVELCRVFAAHVAVAVENARLFAELSEAKEWREALIDSALDAVVAIDQDRRITVFNRAAEEIFGWTAGEMVGQRVTRLHMDVEKAREIFETVNRGEVVSGWEVELKHRDGTPIPVLLSATVIRDSQGKPIGQAGFMRDLRQVALLEERLRALIRVSQAITGTLELEKVLDQVVRSALDAFPMALSGTIHLYDERADVLRVRASTWDYSPEAISALDFQIGEGITGWVFEHRQAVVVNDAEQDPRYKRIEHPEVLPHKSLMCVPLQVRERVIGVLSLANTDATGAFRAEDLRLLTTFGDQAAIAIDNARLYQDAQEGKAYIRSLYEASNTLISAQESERVLRNIVELARVAADAAWVSVILVDEMGQARNLITAGTDKQFDITDVIRPNGLTMQVMRTGVAEVIEDTNRQRERVNPSMFRNNVAAALCLPLSLQGARIGAMWIHYDQPRRFHQFEIEALQLYANQAAMAYDNARRMEELEHMRQAAEALAGAVNLQEVLEQIVHSAREVLQADSTAIWSYDAVLDKFIMQGSVAAGIPDEVWEKFRGEEPRRGQTAYAVMERDWIVVEDVSDEERYPFLGESTRELLGLIEAQSFYGIPLKVGEEKLGVLYVNYNCPRRFSERERETVQNFANHASLALKNARLLAQMQRTQEAAGVIAGVTVQEDLEQTLKTIAQRTQHVLRSDAVTLYSYDETTRQFGEWATEIVDARQPDSARTPDKLTSTSVVWSILNLTEPRYYHLADDHAAQDELLGGHFVEAESIRAAIGIQLRVGEHKVGVMFVNFRSPHRFTSDEIDTIQLFADQAAVAIRNAELYRNLQQQYEELKWTKGLVNARTALAWMGMASSVWQHSAGKHAVTIREQAQQLRGDLSKVRLHEQHVRVAERLSMIERLASRILEKPMTLPLSAEEGLESVAVNELIGERAEQLWQNDPYKKAELRPDLQLSGLATVRVSREWLRRAFDVLVDNAVEAVSDREVQVITIGTRAANGGAEILVSDTGPGIPEETRSKIGLDFIEKPEDARGLGMGLLMAQTIVQTYGGEIRVEATGPTGTTMAIWLPLE